MKLYITEAFLLENTACNAALKVYDVLRRMSYPKVVSVSAMVDCFVKGGQAPPFELLQDVIYWVGVRLNDPKYRKTSSHFRMIGISSHNVKNDLTPTEHRQIAIHAVTLLLRKYYEAH